MLLQKRCTSLGGITTVSLQDSSLSAVKSSKTHQARVTYTFVFGLCLSLHLCLHAHATASELGLSTCCCNVCGIYRHGAGRRHLTDLTMLPQLSAFLAIEAQVCPKGTSGQALCQCHAPGCGTRCGSPRRAPLLLAPGPDGIWCLEVL